MDRLDSDPSNGSNGSRPGSSAPFAYQARLLERTSSRGGPHSLSRANSQSSTLSLLTNSTGSSAGSITTKRWGSHRPASSLDVMRGKREDRPRETLTEEPRSSSPTKDVFRSKNSSSSSTTLPSIPSADDRPFHTWDRPMTPPSMSTYNKDTTTTPTPKYLKRQTMPAPIIASPLSPNSTGISVEADSPLSTTPHRIRIPVRETNTPTDPSSWRSQLKSTSSASPTKSSTSFSPSPSTTSPSFTRPFRSQTLDTSSPTWKTSNNLTSRLDSSTSTPSFKLDDDRKTSSPRAYGHRPTQSIESIHIPANHRPTSRYGAPTSPAPASASTSSPSIATAPSTPTVPSVTITPSPASPSNNIMFPPPYRSSYMSNKKSGSFDSLSAGSPSTSRRRLGNHLPRIASGDAEDVPDKENPPKKLDFNSNPTATATTNTNSTLKPDYSDRHITKDPVSIRRQERTTRVRDRRFAAVIQEKKLTPSGVLTGNGVAGLPGRISLKAPSGPDGAPTSTSRFLGGSWADKQRHLLQAYEYLCHVGEAQQWIEGCLGEELQCGVVELEDHLQNGVILARLVRAFQGEEAVKKIYEGGTKRYNFMHSENINHFVRFVREMSLPEGFVFELTDLYEKKNLPKVIYCIHALSHLLAYRGMAQKIGNLLGQLHFSDDQLIRTQKGLKDAGVAMPNFGNVGKEVAKEINEPETQEETEDEKRDRMLLECESSIIALQQQARGYLVRNAVRDTKNRCHLAKGHIIKLQTQAKGVLVRRRVAQQRKSQAALVPFATALQARARGLLVRRKWRAHLRALRASIGSFVKVQAQIRGVLQRRRYQKLKGALQKINFPTRKLQAAARGHILRRTQKEITKSFFKPKVNLAVVALQAHCRGLLIRRSVDKKMYRLLKAEGSVVKLQAHCRGLIVRRRLRAQQTKLRNVADIVIGIQSAVRTYLARKRLLALIRGLRKATSVIVAFQAQAKASLVRQKQESLKKALVDVRTIKAVGKLQAMARASIVRTQHRELEKKLEISMPDVIGLQSTARGAMVREDYHAWRDHLHRNHHIATVLQSMFRSALIRRAFRKKMEYFRTNLSKVVKIQSLFRAKEMREQYRQLTLGKNVTVTTIKNFVHLLDDSEADFQEEIKVERLRKRVVEAIRENQALEHDIDELEQRIARLVDNMRTVEDIVMAKKKYGSEASTLHAARASLLAKHGDIFSAVNTLDSEARRKVELYQQLFYLLQTRPEYLGGLLSNLSLDDTPEDNRRFVERTILTLFGYGQDRREDFLLLKLFQQAIKDEVTQASSLDSIIFGHPLYLNIAVQYVRPRKATYVKDALQGIIRELIETDDLDLESDPCRIHRARVEVEEMRSAKPSNIPKDLPFREAIEDPATRAIYIRHLQLLQWWTEAFVNVITQSTRKMPYNMRYLARETFAALQEKFPGASPELYGACLGRLVFYHYIQPVLENPDAFDIVPKATLMTTAKQNLEEISKVLEQITTGVEFDADKPSYVPVNDFVHKAISQMTAWYFDVANVPDAEAQFHAHEFMDATVQPKAIYISPNEIYTIHSLLTKQVSQQKLNRDDDLRVILAELGPPPRLDIAELKDARETQITLELTNRFAHVKDPQAEEKTLWVQAKRGVLAILRVQPAQDLLESLMRPVTDNDEYLWEEILETELESEMRQVPRRQPSAVNDAAYRLEDIRLLKFAAVKALAISNLLELEKQGKISREDGFQGILNAIAGDVRSKHRKRLQRQQEMQNMNEALRQLGERKKFCQEQLDTYQAVAESAMSTMQRGGKQKRHFALPFTKQFFHQRDLHKAGATPQFGSYIYSAKQLYNRRILLSIDSYSPRQFDKLEVTLSSNVPGIFNVRLESTILGINSCIGTEDIRMEDLLQAKYEKKASISILKGKAKVNLELFLGQINKKFNS